MAIGIAMKLIPGADNARTSLRQAYFKFMVFVGIRLLGILFTIFLLGFSLLPLAALLLLIPAFLPEETVLTESSQRTRSFWKQLSRRLFAVISGFGMLLALLAFSTEVVTRLDWRSPYFGQLAATFFGKDLVNRLPAAMGEGWPYLMLVMYSTDLILLFMIGKIPLNYNIRNLVVRWRITLLTGLAFTVVVALLTLMLGFVNGLNVLTSSSGVPGNVMILSEGATDELFSNMAYGDVGKLELERATLDKNGDPLLKPVDIKTISNPKGGGVLRLLSKETYFVINQETGKLPNGATRRRFVQLRGVHDSYIAGKVHNIQLLEGEWFPDSGAVSLSDGRTATPAVLGEGAATKFGEDVGKDRLNVGDTFMLGDLTMIVSGIMKSEGSTFGSEVWSQWSRVSKEFRKESYTTLVLRVADDSLQSAEQMADYLSFHVRNPRVTARSEPRYFEDLSKSNQQLLYIVIVVAIIMAIGGIFGVMNTMFAAIAQRIRDIGVLRILGFKRWQILVSFMLESLAIAILGGLVGVLIGHIGNNSQVTSTLSSGQGNKSVIMRILVDSDVMICGLLFTIVMGRLGGLVPALSAMRLGILQSLK